MGWVTLQGHVIRGNINKADYSHGKGIGDSTLVVENESLQIGHWLGGERPKLLSQLCLLLFGRSLHSIQNHRTNSSRQRVIEAMAMATVLMSLEPYRIVL